MDGFFYCNSKEYKEYLQNKPAGEIKTKTWNLTEELKEHFNLSIKVWNEKIKEFKPGNLF